MRNLSETGKTRYDLIIVGGGSLGSAMAWEAASRGLRVALLEKEDFGSQTSANSLRIVHGGLRYLQTLDIRRARRSIRERSAFLRIAPHLVAPLRCALPSFPGLMRSRAALGAGLLLNAVLSVDRNRRLDPLRRLPAGGLLPRSSLEEAAPGVSFAGTTGGAYWYDAIMLDAERLCLAFVLSAASAGALVANHAEVTALFEANGGSAAVSGIDRLSGEHFELRAAAIADCRGPWIPHDPLGAAPSAEKTLKAVNVLLRTPQLSYGIAFPGREANGRLIRGRLFFAVPIAGASAIGTWYFHSPCHPDESGLTDKERNQIVRDLSHACPGWEITPDSILGAEIGLLHASSEPGEPLPAERPRIARLSPESGSAAVWRIETEKWTTVRSLAETAVTEICATEGLAAEASRTRETPIWGGDLDGMPNLRDTLRKALPGGAKPDEIERLLNLYGSHSVRIATDARESDRLRQRVPGAETVSRAEIAHVLRHEMPGTLTDLIVRRLGLAIVSKPPPEAVEFIAKEIATSESWSPEQLDRNVTAFNTHLRNRGLC